MADQLHCKINLSLTRERCSAACVCSTLSHKNSCYIPLNYFSFQQENLTFPWITVSSLFFVMFFLHWRKCWMKKSKPCHKSTEIPFWGYIQYEHYGPLLICLNISYNVDKNRFQVAFSVENCGNLTLVIFRSNLTREDNRRWLKDEVYFHLNQAYWPWFPKTCCNEEVG